VFVDTFPLGGGEWQVSLEDGSYPKWCRGGHELVYYDVSRNSMVAVDVELKLVFRASAPRVLFNLSPAQYSSMQTNPSVNYDVSADGENFVFMQSAGPAQPSATLSVRLNLPAEILALTETQ
jgi:hypothetical protein